MIELSLNVTGLGSEGLYWTNFSIEPSPLNF